MAWETRNGREYYYRKHRIGRHVISEYVGTGYLAELTAGTDEQERDEREAERKAWNRAKAEILSTDREVNQTMDTCSALVNAILVVSGFHTHKGQWRLRRGQR